MTVRPTLLDEWRTRLAEWRQRAEHGSHRAWWARLYVRLYSFLIRRYGCAADEAHQVPMQPAERESSMPFFAATPIESPHPPRSADRIRAVLDAVHESNPGLDRAGPLVEGLGADETITLESFPTKRAAEQLVARLRRASIQSSIHKSGRRYHVTVRMADRQQASAYVERQPAVWQVRRRVLWKQLLATVGAFVGFHLGIFAGAWLMIVNRADASAWSGSADRIGAVLAVGALGAFVGVAVGFIVGMILDD